MRKSVLKHSLFKSLDPFLRVSRLIAIEKVGGDKRDLYNLLAKLMVLLRQILVNLAIAAITEVILMRISAEQVPSLHRVAARYLKRF